ncbi:MAG: class I SAM-dependent methyltransferase [Minisyncoccia bacterium]
MHIPLVSYWFSKRQLLPTQTTFITLGDNTVFKRAYHERLRSFKKMLGHKKPRLKDIVCEVKNHLKTSTSSTDAVSFAYDKEYAGSEPHYSYLSPILLPIGFETITGYDPKKVSALKIHDVGAGSNEFLRFCYNELNISKSSLYGSDISQESVAIIKRDGFSAYHGRLEQLHLPTNSFDLIFLSYFIDYDTDQVATFKSAIDLVRPGGKIVLEGWFPVRQFALLPSDKSSFTFITKGKNKFEDTALIFNYVQGVCLAQGYTIELERVCEGTRYVYSRYGFQKLPSWFLTLRIQK